MAVRMRLSRLRWAVLVQLAKSWRLGLAVPVSRIIRVFRLNSKLVYMFLEELEGEGVAERVGRGWWRLRDSARARALAEYVLSSLEDTGYGYWQTVVPEVFYYVAEPPSIEWLGYPGRTLTIVDEALKGRLGPPKGYLVVYTSMRGRAWRYDWDSRVARAEAEQALADLLSYDPDYPVEQYLLNNLDSVDLDEVARRATLEGLKRLSTFLAFLRVAAGKPIPAGLDYLVLADPGVLRERLGEYTALVFANGIDAARGV